MELYEPALLAKFQVLFASEPRSEQCKQLAQQVARLGWEFLDAEDVIDTASRGVFAEHNGEVRQDVLISALAERTGLTEERVEQIITTRGIYR